MRITIMTVAFVLLAAQFGAAQEVRSFAEIGPHGVAAGGRLSGFDRGFIDTRGRSGARFVRSTTVGQSPDGGLVIGISYAMQPLARRAIAVHVSRAATETTVISSRGSLRVIGSPCRIRIEGGIYFDRRTVAWINADGTATRGAILGEARGGSR